MHRRLSAWILLLAILSASAGMLVFATLHLHLHHYRMARMSHTAHETVEVNALDHPDLLQGACEIRLNGRWFDVKRFDQKEGHLYVTGHYDDDEDDLLKRVHRFSDEIGKRGKDWAPVLLPPVYLESIETPAWNKQFCLELAFAEPFQGLPEPVVSPMVPPPLMFG
ncbi:MAG TPA: hypothetical protein PLI08_11620 [Bacteroidia bacterium]|nr:hypothetical protein [Bacteroidia bacterium]